MSTTPSIVSGLPRPPVLGVITITYNAAAFLDAFLRCCFAQSLQDFVLLAIDNASGDDTLAVLGQCSDPRLKTIANPVNTGYAAACNQGARLLMDDGIEEILFINNDTEFSPDLFASLLELRQRHGADAITPRITYFSAPDRNWYAGGRFVFWKGFQGELIGDGQVHQPGDETPRWTDVATGCCILFSAAVFRRVGLFDENYFVYFEDTDHFLRMKRAGLRLLYAPGTTLAHKVSLSTGGTQSPFSIRYYQRNQIYLLRKLFGTAILCIQMPIIVGKALARLALGKDSPAQTKLRLQAIREGLRMPLQADADTPFVPKTPLRSTD
jgi:hypothetical protein